MLDDYPRGPGSDLLNHLMSDSVRVFADHPVNRLDVKAGKLPATNVWLWGQGRTPGLRPFADVYGKRGAMITAVDLLRGLAALIGWERIEVPGATGYLDTDYAAKGRYAIEALARHRRRLRSCRSHRRSVARRARATPRSKPWKKSTGTSSRRWREALRKLGRLSHSGHARPSHAAAHQNAQPRRCAVRDCRHGHCSLTRIADIRRIVGRQVGFGFRRGLEIDGVFSGSRE